MKTISTDRIGRREFLKAAGMAAAAMAAPAIVPASALGKDDKAAPSERIVVGAIGQGPRGRYDLSHFLTEPDVHFEMVCDVQASRRRLVQAMAAAKGHGHCAMTRDFFELFGRKDIDAVLIATGDRWHALASILAAKAGKDVYCEKPCGITIHDCQQLADTMHRYGRVFQAGTQRRSIANFQFAVHLARSGKLGRLRTLHASIYHLRVLYNWLPAQPQPPIDQVDWNRWLGPAPWRPYNVTYVRGGWRGYYDFDSGATLLDWGAHTVDLCQWANDADTTEPLTYEPDGWNIYARYANGVKLVLRPDGWLNVGTCPVRFVGDKGWVETGDSGRVVVHPASLMGERKRFDVSGLNSGGHIRNFLDCVKSRATPAAGPDIMRHSHIACHAAAISWMLGRKVTLDPAKEQFVGDAEANRMRTRAKRAPWHA